MTDDNGNLFQFDSFGDAPPRYSIANYQKHENNNTYYWRQVGTYISKFLISHKCLLIFSNCFLKIIIWQIFLSEMKFSICVTYFVAIYYFHLLELHVSDFFFSNFGV